MNITDTVPDDETDMKELEAAVRSIEKDGLVWGSSKLVAVGFGIKKLQINLVIEDDKVGLSDLQEEVEEFEDFVQSSDIVGYTCHTLPILANSYLGYYAKAIDHLSVAGTFARGI